MENLRKNKAEENSAPPFRSSASVESVNGQPPSQYECPICLHWLQDPVLTSCGHRFCDSCINAWLQQGHLCPVDNVALKSTDLFPDNYTKREILQQSLICPYTANGCNAQITRMELDKHINICKFKIIPSTPSPKLSKICCPFKIFGCQVLLKNEEQLVLHSESSIQTHLHLLMGAYVKMGIDKDVDGACASTKSNEATHLWDPDDKQNTSTDSQVSCANSDEIMSVRSLMRGLYERVVILEQKNHEQDISIGNLSRIITATSTSHRQLIEEMPLKYCFGTHIWKIDTFSAKLDMLLKDSTTMLYSNGFYTSPNGYRFCARLNSSPIQPDFLSLHVHIMKSDNDVCLDWPFSGKISLCLVNPTFPQLTQKDTMMSKPDIIAFQKPISEKSSRGFGFVNYISAEDIKLKGFIVADCLRIKINIEPTLQ